MNVLNFNKNKFLIICVSFLFCVSCSHIQNNPLIEQPDLMSEPEKKTTYGSFLPKQNLDIVVQGIKLKNKNFDFPITINSQVEHWVDYFCGKGRSYFQKYLERSEFFIPYIAPLLKQNELPEDLVYLAMIESGFNNLARSHARAVGPWQFMASTGKHYGLMVNWWVDYRRDIRKSTLAAAKYLKDLYQIFQSWELAAAAYNAGETKVARAIQRFGSKDFWLISRHRFLRPETRHYVPKIIAAALIAKNREQFGFSKQNLMEPGENEAIAGNGEVVELVKTDKLMEDPDYQQEKAMDTQMGVILSSSTENSRPENQMIPLAKLIPTPHVTKQGHVGGEELTEFEVQSPADLLKIAHAAGLAYQTVKNLNPEILRWCTPPRVGKYRIKLPTSVKDRFLVAYNAVAFPRKVQFMRYSVRRGDTLFRIARHFGIHVDSMSDLNRISPKMSLKHGSTVFLPMPTDRTRTFASLELRDPPMRRKGGSRRHSATRHHRRRLPSSTSLAISRADS